MAILTKKELQEAFSMSSKLFTAVQLLDGLRQCGQTTESQSIQEAISCMEISVNQMQCKAEAMKASILDTLSVVEDDTARIGLMLHYYEGYPWPLVASVVGGNGDSIRSRAYRAMRVAGIR